ncbi:MAG TPA: phenylalanine--tRNA ligase subunit beta [Solirubrobacteraceae bacterium]|nr:phenylalanine--tRNA ligase subunit beta [Solirubrobacteraceae bacterium]
MRLPLLWLHDYCDPGLPAHELATRLALTGTEVDRVHTHGVAALEFFRVGKVLRAEQHPDADRLRVCVVDLGDGEPHQIVCGAPNVAAGQTVAVASPGAVMPGGAKLKKAKLRGQESNGMILSERELELSEEHDGIAVLDTDAPPGTPLEEVLPIATDVLELEITPNRPDCLSVYGVAREVHAATGTPLAPPPWTDDPHPAGDAIPGFSVEVRAPELCPRFTARLFEDVTLGPSPHWLKARLMAAGQRPINNVVDITNYVMLLTGQPMHAFDADLVAGGRLVVRRARDGETMTTLDDLERTLDGETCVIDDADGPTSIAGVMGGARSEVRDTTTRVLMEAATWHGPNIQRTSTRLALRTEASGRFEKQLQPEQGLDGQAVATKLMIELCGARPVGGTIDVGGPGPEPVTLRLRDVRTERLLGAPVPRTDAARILAGLGFGVADAQDGLDVTVPAWRRADVEREADLIEEVARVWGLDRLPSTLPSRRGAVGRLAPAQRLRRRAEDALVGAGLSEAVGWSFTARETAQKLALPGAGAVVLENPMSEEQAVMRTTLLGSLLDSLRRNTSRGMEDVRLFEVGAVYFAGAATGPTGNPWYPEPDPALPAEGTRVAALLTGRLRAPSWSEPEPPRADFFAAKGVLEALMHALRIPVEVRRSDEDPFLHPGRAARLIVRRGEEVLTAGWLGELHPAVAARWDLEAAVAGFELDFGVLVAVAPPEPRYEDLTSFPGITQDVAVVVGDDVPAAAVLEAVRGAGGALLRSAEVFDVYRGAQVGDGRASLAVRLEFRAADRTLTDEEVAARREKIVAALREQVGGELRG